MIAAISGTSGFIGRFLAQKMQNLNWEVKRMSRDTFSLPLSEFTDRFISGTDVVINLAGSPVSGRWNPTVKKEILESRTTTTRKISDAIIQAQTRPCLFISASAIGIYNNEMVHTEESTGFGGSFLAQVCKQWEAEAMPASNLTRVVIMRLGVVLGEEGGALSKMYLPFSVGAGGKLGSGQQPVSFIHLSDLAEAILFIINQPAITGIVNATTPYPTDNAEFTDKLGKVLNKPALFTIPRAVLKMIYGEGASVLLEGQRVLPEKLIKAGFRFKYPTIQNALVEIYR